ncbi:MAG: hypothetical protein RLZZ214_2876 [Verrucomicrobiota bacterium]|jgi:uncharacterized membrane protein YedE/YeeE
MKRLVIIIVLSLTALAGAADFGVDARDYDGGAWSPYLVGAGIGVLSWLTFYFSDKPIGASSFYATLAGYIGKLVAKRHTESLAYFKSNPPSVNWGFVFVISTIVGGFIAAWTGGEIRNEWLHPMWVDRFGDGMALRGIIGFAGGVLMAFGSRLAGGCTSGHGISGTLQLNAGSWLTVICMFIAAITTAMLLYTVL